MGIKEEELYDGYEEGQVKELKGVTDTVTDTAFTTLDFPAIVFKDGMKLPTHQAKVISSMVKSSAQFGAKDIGLYLQHGSDLFKMGSISGLQVDSLLTITGTDKVIGFYSDGSKLEGNKIYTLCTFMGY